MKLLITTTILLLTFIVQAQNPIPPSFPGQNNTSPNIPDFCQIACLSGCPPTAASCHSKSLNIVEQAIDENIASLYYNNENTLLSDVFQGSNEFGNYQIVTKVTDKEYTSNMVFKSKQTDSLITAVVTKSINTNKKDTPKHSVVINFPKGQLIMDNKKISILTESEYSEVDVLDFAMGKIDDKQFVNLMDTLMNDYSAIDFIMTISRLTYEKGFLSCLGGGLQVLGGLVGAGVGVLAEGVSLGTSTALVMGGIGLVGSGLATVDGCHLN